MLSDRDFQKMLLEHNSCHNHMCTVLTVSWCGHCRVVIPLPLSPSAVGGKECEITLCDIHSGSSTHILRSHSLPVMSLAWSPLNDFTLASGSQDNRVLLWDIRMATGPLKSLDQHNGSGDSNSAAGEYYARLDTHHY